MNVVNVISSLLVIGIIACACIGICTVVNWFLEGCDSPLRRWRKMHTPSCFECKHGYDDGAEFVCCCPQAIDARERGTAKCVDKVPAYLVRGTRYCKFERDEGGE